MAPVGDAATIIDLEPVPQGPSQPSLRAQDRTSLDKVVERRFVRDFARTLRETAPAQQRRLGDPDADAVSASVEAILEDVAGVGFRRKSDIARLATIAFFYGRWVMWDPRNVALARSTLGAEDRSPALRALRFEEGLKARADHGAITEDAGLARVLANLRAHVRRGHDADAGWHFEDARTRARFRRVCEDQQDHHGLPAAGTTYHRAAHTAIACLWTPFFLDDPAHAQLLALFQDASEGIEARLIETLSGRLGEGVLKQPGG
ncbi:hypothetical protein KDD17_17445 [Sulfitobacter albidus]|uniref:Uncharacterized protein n=1 Tax=Sulfitobacter albidus TaxID=2829501 RepID=A0A975PP36_9RHOB|nr:hypothetical protein [Sulfitobacter albidus]QUJ78126.1 hypothetical protein KDD17_17445 [Sulfitobacter albidus]